MPDRVRSDHAKCDACEADIRFAFTKNGKQTPVDLKPSLEGTIRLVVRGDRIEADELTGFELMSAHLAEEELYTTHWATCTEPDRFRKRSKLRKASSL